MSKLLQRRTRPNYFYALLSVALVLFLLGFFGVIILHAQQFVRLYKERVNLMVELKSTAAPQALDSLTQLLEEADYTRTGSISTVTREQATKLMSRELGEDFLKMDMPNPFLDLVFFNVRAEYMDAGQLQQIRSELKSLPMVNDVYYQEGLVDDIARNLKNLSYFALGFGLFFIFISAALIHNTIRLALYSNRFLIKNMELVGASWGFISRPHLIRAFLHGLLSSLMAILALVGLLYWIGNTFPEVSLFHDLKLMLIVIGLLILLGVGIYLLSTYYVVNKYLRMRMDDLY